MKATVDLRALDAALKWFKSFMPRRSIHPECFNILLQQKGDRLALCSFDEHGATAIAFLLCTGITLSGACVVPTALLKDVVGGLCSWEEVVDLAAIASDEPGMMHLWLKPQTLDGMTKISAEYVLDAKVGDGFPCSASDIQVEEKDHQIFQVKFRDLKEALRLCSATVGNKIPLNRIRLKIVYRNGRYFAEFVAASDHEVVRQALQIGAIVPDLQKNSLEWKKVQGQDCWNLMVNGEKSGYTISLEEGTEGSKSYCILLDGAPVQDCSARHIKKLKNAKECGEELWKEAALAEYCQQLDYREEFRWMPAAIANSINKLPEHEYLSFSLSPETIQVATPDGSYLISFPDEPTKEDQSFDQSVDQYVEKIEDDLKGGLPIQVDRKKLIKALESLTTQVDKKTEDVEVVLAASTSDLILESKTGTTRVALLKPIDATLVSSQHLRIAGKRTIALLKGVPAAQTIGLRLHPDQFPSYFVATVDNADGRVAILSTATVEPCKIPYQWERIAIEGQDVSIPCLTVIENNAGHYPAISIDEAGKWIVRSRACCLEGRNEFSVLQVLQSSTRRSYYRLSTEERVGAIEHYWKAEERWETQELDQNPYEPQDQNATEQ